MSNRPCSVYLIDKESVGKEISSDVVSSIMRKINHEISEESAKCGKTKYTYMQQKIDSAWLNGELSIQLYYRSHKYIPEWRGFFSAISETNSSIREAENKMASVICFIYNEDYVFAVCTGHGTYPILKYIDSNFGLEILTKLIDEKSSVIKSRRSRGITGNTLAASQIYKKDQLILAEEAYGQLFKEISADLDCEVIENKLGLDIGERDMASCVAKTSFKLNKSISFGHLVSFVRHLIVLKNDANSGFNINRLKFVNNRTNSEKALTESLNLKLKKELHKYLRNSLEVFAFEICHQEYEDYFFADRYSIEYSGNDGRAVFYDNRISFADIKEYLKSNFSDAFSTQKGFLSIVDKISITSYESTGQKKTSGKLITHLNGEMSFDNETYFYIDDKWIQMIGNLVEELDSDVSSIIHNLNANRKINALGLMKWDRNNHKTEDDYNLSYLNTDKTLVFHKVLYQNIEMADVLRWNDQEIYLIHVKKGFDSSMRDLTNQVNNAARILMNERKSNELKFAEELYDYLQKVKNNINKYAAYLSSICHQVDTITKEDFVSLFKEKDIKFCMAILDEDDTRNICEIKKYDSNIAKLSTLDLIRNMSTLNVDLLIEEI